MTRLLAATAVVTLMAVCAVTSASTAAVSESGRYNTNLFRTPSAAAYCGIGEAGFYCWTPNDGFVVLMDGAGRPVHGYGTEYRGRKPHVRTLRFGKRWHDGYVACVSRR